MEGHLPIYQRLLERGSSPNLDPRWQFVQPSDRFGFLGIDPERTLPSLLDEFDEEELIRSRVTIRRDDDLVLNPMLTTDDRLAALIDDYDVVTSRGALVHTAPLFAMDQDWTTMAKRLGPDSFLFIVGSMQEYLLFDSLGMAASPATYLDRLGRGGLESMLYLVDGDSDGLIAREWRISRGMRFELDGYVGSEESRPATMCLVFVGYELNSGRRGFAEEAIGAMQLLFLAQERLKVNWDEIYVWWPTEEEIEELEFRRRLSDVDFIHEFFRDRESLQRIKTFFDSLRRPDEAPLVKSLENLFEAQQKMQEHPEMSHYRRKMEKALREYMDQVDQATFLPLVDGARNSNDLRIRNLRLQHAHVSRLIHLGMPSIYSAQAHRLPSGCLESTELFPEVAWKQMAQLLNAQVKLVREETRIRASSRRS